jgi:hypothetical protein
LTAIFVDNPVLTIDNTGSADHYPGLLTSTNISYELPCHFHQESSRTADTERDGGAEI